MTKAEEIQLIIQELTEDRNINLSIIERKIPQMYQ